MKFVDSLSTASWSRSSINMLKKEGNTDPSKLFMTWDWETSTPLCEPLKTPEEYATLIKEHFYNK